MTNWIWIILILSGIIISIFTGKIIDIGRIILSSSTDAFNLFLKMSIVILFWNGIFNILKDSGFLKKLSKLLSRFLKLVFSELGEDSKALEYISLTLLSNFLGLGVASTSTGLKAFEYLKEEAKGKMLPTKSMITFIILNITSITIFPTTIISIRNAYLGITDLKLIFVIFVTTCFGTIVGLILNGLLNRGKK